MLANDGVNAAAFNFKHAGLIRTECDRFLGIIPMFTAYGLVCGLRMPLCLGCELVPTPRFEVRNFGRLVRRFKPDHMISTSAFYETLMEDRGFDGFDLSFVVTVGSGGDAMNAGLEERFHAFLREHNMKYPLAQGYGRSEASAAVSFCVGAVYKLGSVGIPSIATTVSIVDPETGFELGFNQIGGVCVSGPTLMGGYLNRPDETEAVMRVHDDGTTWVHTGDLGYVDEDGFLFVEGCKKRMVTRFDGRKVFPVNIEGIVAAHEGVRNVCVVGGGRHAPLQRAVPFGSRRAGRGVRSRGMPAPVSRMSGALRGAWSFCCCCGC